MKLTRAFYTRAAETGKPEWDNSAVIRAFEDAEIAADVRKPSSGD